MLPESLFLIVNILGINSEESSPSQSFKPDAVFENHHERCIYSVDWSKPFASTSADKDGNINSGKDRLSSFIATAGADDAICVINVTPKLGPERSTLLEDQSEKQVPVLKNGGSSTSKEYSYTSIIQHQHAHDGDVNCVKYVSDFTISF